MSRDTECIRLMEAFQYVDNRFLDMVEQQKKVRKRKHAREVLSAVAAGIGLFLVLPVAAMAYNWFGLRDLILPEREEELTGLTLWEYMYRPETRAVMDWKNFLAGYDIDGKILAEAEKEGFDAEGREDWVLYGVYSREMGEKLDEIVGKYKLKLHTDRYTISFQELEAMVGGTFMEGSGIENDEAGKRNDEESGKGEVLLYEDGSFQFYSSAALEKCGTVDFQFRCAVTGSFDEAAPFYWRDEGDEEWQYTSVYGESLLLVLGNFRTLIYAEFDECLMTVDTVCGRDCGMTQEDLQELADKVDFRMLEDMYASKLGRGFRVSPGDTITMSGYPGSPEALALAEWREFLAGYDTDGKILDEIGNDLFVVEGREDWFLYSVYSYEMGEKLDEITDKYGLQLHREINVVSPKEMDYRVGGSFLDESCEKWSGYIYEDGSFSSGGDVNLDGCGMTGFSLSRIVKGTFDESVLNIGDVEDYTDWQYLSASGEQVMLSLGHIRALVFADFEECFISIYVLAGRNEGMTEEDLQELADKIDFQRLKEVQVPDMRGDSELPFIE